MDPKEREFAEKMTMNIQHGRPSQSENLSAMCNSSQRLSSIFMAPKRAARNITMSLKDVKAKFSRDMSQWWDKYLNLYSQAARDYRPSDQ